MTIENIYKLNTKNWQHKIGTVGEIVTDIEDIEQCYAVIFRTQIGSVVFNPNLGWDIMEYLGKPLNIAGSRMRTALLSALNKQEPRAQAVSADFDYENSANGILTVKVEFTIKNTNKTYNTGAIKL